MTRRRVLFAHYAVIDREGFGRTFMLAREMAIRGHEVMFLTTLPATRFRFPYHTETREDVQVFAFPDIVPDSLRRTGFGLLSILLKLAFVLRRKFHFVHGDNGHRPSSGWPCKLNRLVHKSVYISEWWDFFGKGGQYDSLSPFKKMTKGTYDLLTEVADKRAADYVVTLSQSMKVRAIEAGIPPSKIEVISGGSDVRTIRYFPDTSHRTAFGLPTENLTFGFIGMNEGEFQDVVPFVEAIQMCSAEINLKWITTGRKIDPKTKAAYRIGNELHEFGWVDYGTYDKLLSCVEVFLLLQEPNTCNQFRWPNKIGDYLAAGRVILTNPVGDVSALSGRFPDSIIQTEFSAVAVCEKIRALQAKRQQLLETGRRNRALAEGEFSWENQANKLSNIYNRFSHATGA